MKARKMAKFARMLDTVFRILQKMLVIGFAIAVALVGVSTVIAAVSPDTAREMLGVGMDVTLELGFVTLEVARGAMPDIKDILLHGWLNLGYGVLIVFLVCYALGKFRKILEPIARERPFVPQVGKEIRKLAFVSLAIGIAGNLLSLAGTLRLLHVFDLDRLLQGSQILSATVNFHFDLAFLLVFLVLLLISYVFQCGEELQKLSDETL